VKKVRKVVELNRRSVGFYVGGRGGLLYCQLLYEIHLSDGSTKLLKGRPLYNMPGILPVGAKMPEDVRADLSVHMQAIQVLLEPLETVCYRLDHPEPKAKRTKVRPTTEKSVPKRGRAPRK
jgi:hypothetical protein